MARNVLIRRSVVLRFLLSSLLATAMFTHVELSRARACTCYLAPIIRSDPADQSEGVPLNQPIIVEGAFVTDTIVLKDPTGLTLDVDVNEGPEPGCPGATARDIERGRA